MLMLQGVSGDTFADDADVDAFLMAVEQDALDETTTLTRTGDWALYATAAFPLIWSRRVHDVLHIDVDTEAIEEQRVESQRAMLAVAERVSSGVQVYCLPVPYAAALSLSAFPLRLGHASLPRNHVVKEMALAARDYAIHGWAAGFYWGWNAMAERYANRVAEGEIKVNLMDYTEFVEARREGLHGLADRLAAVDFEEAFATFDNASAAVPRAGRVQHVGCIRAGLVLCRLRIGPRPVGSRASGR